jgi:hypothetical protein
VAIEVEDVDVWAIAAVVKRQSDSNVSVRNFFISLFVLL